MVVFPRYSLNHGAFIYAAAMISLFGEEITPQHITIFATLKKLIARWRARAAQRKNIVAVEHFARDELQKRAIIKHKEQAVVNV